MKKIVLIGDSVRMGYDKYVKEKLKDVAIVEYPKTNCSYAQTVLRYSVDWRDEAGWDDADLVHWNAGLHDVLELFGEEPMTPPEFYELLIKRIHKRLRLLFPSAKIVFATSTAVLEEEYGENFKRRNSVIKQYNEIAKNALKDTDAIINDLFAITENCPRDCHNDVTHYGNEKGIKLLGDQVLSVICRELSLPLPIDELKDFTPENYTADQILK